MPSHGFAKKPPPFIPPPACTGGKSVYIPPPTPCGTFHVNLALFLTHPYPPMGFLFLGPLNEHAGSCAFDVAWDQWIAGEWWHASVAVRAYASPHHLDAVVAITRDYQPWAGGICTFAALSGKYPWRQKLPQSSFTQLEPAKPSTIRFLAQTWPFPQKYLCVFQLAQPPLWFPV